MRPILYPASDPVLSHNRLAEVSGLCENIEDQPEAVEVNRQIVQAMADAQTAATELFGIIPMKTERVTSYSGKVRYFLHLNPEGGRPFVTGMGDTIQEAVLDAAQTLDREHHITPLPDDSGFEVEGWCRVTLEGANENWESTLAKARRFALSPTYLNIALHYGFDGVQDIRPEGKNPPVCDGCHTRHHADQDCFDPR